MPDFLIPHFDSMGSKEMSEEFTAIAHNIEKAFLQVGAIPGKDYTYKDLFDIASPFVLHKFKNGSANYIYPATEVTKP
ncbi:hypothetical protein H8E88_02665 [candidate division KSB1 bacterium]|nr:hypothetical protein [candidate division KSB1 bacterium]